jgi:iron complex transport system substrate-binding protein
MMDRVVAVDDYTLWPPEAGDLPRIGGYLDPSPEAVASLSATSIHSVGNSPRLEELADNLGIPYHHYSFDTLDDVMASCESLEALYPEASFDPFRERLDRVFRQNRVEDGGTASLVVFHSDDGRFTLAGAGTFFEDLLRGLGCSLAAPSAGTYPDVSVEGILRLDPDALIFLAPDETDTLGLLEAQKDFWEARGFPRERVFVLGGDFMLIPGARLPKIAERLSACLSSH